MDNYFFDHILDLSNKCMSKGIYTYSNFLNEDEINIILSHKKDLCEFELFGGTEGAARKMICFGCEEELFYEKSFPIKTIKITPKNKKFAETLSHRDVLGSLMSLSIEREHIGDIIIHNDEIFVFVTEKMCNYITENLTRIKHTDINCVVSEFNNEIALFNLKEIEVISSSLRADCVICAVYKLSRNSCNELFASKKVFINSCLCENTSKALKENDTVSLRGYGKFIFNKALSQTKKGRIKLSISVYI